MIVKFIPVMWYEKIDTLYLTYHLIYCVDIQPVLLIGDGFLGRSSRLEWFSYRCDQKLEYSGMMASTRLSYDLWAF